MNENQRKLVRRMGKSGKAYLIIMAVLIALTVITNSDWGKDTDEVPGSNTDPVTVTVTVSPTPRPVTPTQKPAAATQKPTVQVTKPIAPTRKPVTPTPKPATPTPVPKVNLFEGYSIPQYRTLYTKLNSVEQHIYRELRATVMQDGNSCVIRNVQYKTYADSIGRAMEALQLDFPEFFWVSGGWQWQATYNGNVGNITITMNFRDYWNDGSNKRQRITTVMNQARAVANAAMQRPTHYERLQYIHDWICANTTYNYDAYESRNDQNRPAAHMQAYSVYGVFAKKTAVCQGYALAYKLIANMCGYTCEYARGEAGGDSHGWNYVTLNGNNYWVDVTWDDEDGRKGSAACRYTYFMVSSKYLYRDHAVNTQHFAAPVCNDDSMDYFNRYGCDFAQYDFSAINASVKRQVAMGDLVHLRFEDRQLMDLAVEYLFGSAGHWRQLEVGDRKNVTYYRDYDQLVISIRINR